MAFEDTERLFIAPDGDLTTLPFEVFPLTAVSHLIDEYRISHLGAGLDVLRFAVESTGTPSAPLVIADPDFDVGDDDISCHEKGYENVIPISQRKPAQNLQDDHAYHAAMPQTATGRTSRDLKRDDIRFDRLPGTRAEGEQIASHGFFLADQKRDPNEDRRNSISVDRESGFGMRQLSASRLENPMLRSGLALAGVNTWLKGGTPPPEAEDGILTAEDVSGLDLLATDLVVLSACETGLGEVHVGEGVFGLRSAFVLAGAKTLVMSLWKVPDQQTQELMVDFYSRVQKEEPRSEALRNAQLAMKKRYPGPLYWGAFICQGDPGSLEE